MTYENPYTGVCGEEWLVELMAGSPIDLDGIGRTCIYSLSPNNHGCTDVARVLKGESSLCYVAPFDKNGNALLPGMCLKALGVIAASLDK